MGLSIRAYAKIRGVSHVAVLKAIKAGRIPIEPDGAIDPGKADAAWERSTDPGRTKSRTKAKPCPQPPSRCITRIGVVPMKRRSDIIKIFAIAALLGIAFY